MALLEVDQLDAWYGRAQVLFGVTLSVAAGEAVVLLGRNGAGKSTTLAAIMGLEAERRGSITFGGVALHTLPPYRIARLGLGYVPEDRRIFAGLTVAANLSVGRLPPRPGFAWTLDDVFTLFPPLLDLRDRLGAHLSGGEQQMLTIARALMGSPRFLLLDEPAEGLAPIVVQAIVDVVGVLKRRGVGMLISEQNLHFARNTADRAYIMELGHIRFAGTMAEIDADPTLAARYLAV
jgi:branched-chain amino acid transport system ATP-binding protein